MLFERTSAAHVGQIKAKGSLEAPFIYIQNMNAFSLSAPFTLLETFLIKRLSQRKIIRVQWIRVLSSPTKFEHNAPVYYSDATVDPTVNFQVNSVITNLNQLYNVWLSVLSVFPLLSVWTLYELNAP